MSLMKQKAQQEHKQQKKMIGATMRTTKGKLTSIKSYLTKVSLIINDFNYPVKGHRLAEWIKKNFQNVKWWWHPALARQSQADLCESVTNLIY